MITCRGHVFSKRIVTLLYQGNNWKERCHKLRQTNCVETWLLLTNWTSNNGKSTRLGSRGTPLLPQRGTQGFGESTTEYGSDSRQKAGRCEYQTIQFWGYPLIQLNHRCRGLWLDPARVNSMLGPEGSEISRLRHVGLSNPKDAICIGDLIMLWISGSHG
jgi:hypothetical protein